MSPAGLTTRRVMGIETEFGITPADHGAHPLNAASASIPLSHFAVGAYALLVDSNRERTRWDYGDETPLRDARGFELQRAAAHPTQLTDDVPDAHQPSIELEHALWQGDAIPAGLDDAATLHYAQRRALSNSVLRNGARLYVDHAHPEYSSPEVTTARDALVYDRAGEEIARAAMRAVRGAEGIPPIALYKNNTDSKGQSYGTHENYLVDRAVPFARLVEILVPFFVTRQIVVGAGRVGIGTRGEHPGFQISSRADFFETEVGLETTLNRPIVNSRDESHADPTRYRRLHVIIGDANLYETATFMKMAMTSLVLALAEKEQRDKAVYLPQVALRNPVQALHQVSHDLTLTRTYEMVDGSRMSALEIQHEYVRAVRAHAGDLASCDSETRQAIHTWQRLLDGLAGDRASVASEIEWVAKHQLIEQFRARHGLGYEDARVQALDIQFSDLREDKSLYLRLVAAGRARTLVSDVEVAQAVHTPPTSTRAYLRGHLVTHHRSHVSSAGWDAVTIASGTGGVRVRCADPLMGSAQWCAQHNVDPTGDLATFITAMSRL